jgi:hypothetical protein
MGARETIVSEEEDAAARKDGEPLTSMAQERRQEVAVAAKHQAAGDSSSPSQERTVAKDVPHQVCPDPGARGKVEEDGYRSDVAETVRVETPPTDPASGNGTTRHTSCSRRQLIRSEYEESMQAWDGRRPRTPENWILAAPTRKTKMSLPAKTCCGP